MKYCEGKCRRNYIKFEGTPYKCAYHRAFTTDKSGGDAKAFEICLKISFLGKVWRWVTLMFFKEFLNANDFRGGRISRTVQNNRSIKF